MQQSKYSSRELLEKMLYIQEASECRMEDEILMDVYVSTKMGEKKIGDGGRVNA